MKAIIPLAGFGTRLRPHTYTKPKPLINVAGKPVLGHLLDKITGLGIEEYIFVVGYLGEQRIPPARAVCRTEGNARPGARHLADT
jgi:glucose-1-phosphate thymidylyltransferase